MHINLRNLSDVDIKVLDVAGKTIHFKEGIKSEKYQFELNEAAGIYFIEVFSGKEKQVFKLIKE